MKAQIKPITVSVDVVIFTLQNDALKVLLIKRSKAPFANTAALPGGAMQVGETSKEAAMRILHDKAGVSNVFVEQLYTFDEPARDPRGRTVSITYYALVPIERLKIQNDPATEEPTLLPVSNLPELAFDHDTILSYAIERLRAKVEYTNIVYSIMQPQFSLGQLQQTYEAILDSKLDKRNFRKKYLGLGLIEPTGKILEGGRHRPAKLYKFSSHNQQEIQRWN